MSTVTWEGTQPLLTPLPATEYARSSGLLPLMESNFQLKADAVKHSTRERLRGLMSYPWKGARTQPPPTMGSSLPGVALAGGLKGKLLDVEADSLTDRTRHTPMWTSRQGRWPRGAVKGQSRSR